MRRRRILFDCLHLRNKSTGVDIYSLNLIKHILSLDSETEYIIIVNSRFNIEKLQSYIPKSSKNYVIKTLWANLPVQILIASFLIPFYLRFKKIDVYHHHFFFGPWYKWVCPKTNIIVTIYDMFHWTIPSQTTPRINWLLKTFADPGMVVADTLIAISESTKQDIIRYITRVNPCNIHVTLLGCEEKYKNINVSIDQLKRFNLDGRPYILYIGHILPKKGLDDLLTAYDLAINKLGLTDHVLLLAGKSEPVYESQLVSRINSTHNLHNLVKLVGYVSDKELVSLYGNARVFVLPSFYEGFGLPAIEAMSMGCPVIARNNSSLAEIVTGAGYLFDNIEQLSHQIYELCTDNESRVRLVGNGLSHAKKFTWEATATLTLNLYNHFRHE